MKVFSTAAARIALLLLGALSWSGCVLVGATFPFADPAPVSGTVGSGTRVLLLPVEDRRPQVLYEGEPPSWVGEQRDFYGIPYNVSTRDHRPLAAIVEETIGRDLAGLGFEVVPHQGPVHDLPGLLARSRADRALVVTIHDLNSNTYFNVDVVWNLEATVYGTDGRVVRRNLDQGAQTLSGTSAGPRNERKVPDFYFRLIRALVIEDVELLAALVERDSARG